MAVTRPAFTIGIEEEYLLVDRETRDLLADPDPRIMKEAEEILAGQVSPEFMRAQIEVGTEKHGTLDDAAKDLAACRRAVAEVAGRYGGALMAASTHPFGRWQDQERTDRERYAGLEDDLQVVARRLLISGMHVHVGIEDQDLRIDLMNQARYFLPHMLALSASSPFWHGYPTGLKSYRPTIFRAMPRTGLPTEFDSWSEYERHINVLVNAGIIEDGTKLWWDLRPSSRYPTLEMRVSDICTRLEDARTVAACWVSLLHMLFRLRSENKRWRAYAKMLVDENLWRAQRYGTEGSLMDIGKGELVPFEHLLEELIDLTRTDAETLGCLPDLIRVRQIASEGTSADRQLRVYNEALDSGAEEKEALVAVVDHLIEDTMYGL